MSISLKDKNVIFSKGASLWFKGIAIIMVILSHYAEWWSWFFTEEGTSELIRDGISRSGPYGVAIFLLFSGYGLVKSAGDVRINGRFVLKRILGVYVPYFIIVLLIEMLSGGFETVDDVLDIFYGQDFWYMTVLFSLYIAFMVIFFVFKNRHIRAILMTGFTILYSYGLYMRGEFDFWYLSNAAFAIGVLLALYEPWIGRVVNKISIPAAILFGVAVAGIVRDALYVEHVWELPLDEIRTRVIAVLIFTMFVVFAAAMWKWYDPVLKWFGKYSLYFYLSHTFLFMWAINHFSYDMGIRFMIAAVITLAVSMVLGILITLLMDVIFGKLEKIVDFKLRKS